MTVEMLPSELVNRAAMANAGYRAGMTGSPMFDVETERRMAIAYLYGTAVMVGGLLGFPVDELDALEGLAIMIDHRAAEISGTRLLS